MKLINPRLEVTAVNKNQYPPMDISEIALAGRSNVGKSSFINTLIERKGLARTSGQPGKTQTLNFYNMDDKFRLVDVPGYGYAKVSKRDRERWANMINEYLTQRDNLITLLLLMDFRHEPTEQDKEMKAFAEELDIPYAIVLTKVDKVKKSQWNRHLSSFVKQLNLPSSDALFLFSSETGEGKEEIWDVIMSQLD